MPRTGSAGRGSVRERHFPIVAVYAAPAENAEPYVRPGDTVQKGRPCASEAMKLMNEIDAEESGVVEKVCVTNGQVVEFGTELFRSGGPHEPEELGATHRGHMPLLDAPGGGEEAVAWYTVRETSSS